MLLGQHFLVHQWADGCAVFDRRTGSTHALDPQAGAGFVAAQAGDDPYRSIEASFRSLHPEASQDDLAALADACFERLKKSGLLEAERSN